MWLIHDTVFNFPLQGVDGRRLVGINSLQKTQKRNVLQRSIAYQGDKLRTGRSIVRKLRTKAAEPFVPRVALHF